MHHSPPPNSPLHPATSRPTPLVMLSQQLVEKFLFRLKDLEMILVIVLVTLPTSEEIATPSTTSPSLLLHLPDGVLGKKLHGLYPLTLRPM